MVQCSIVGNVARVPARNFFRDDCHMHTYIAHTPSTYILAHIYVGSHFSVLGPSPAGPPRRRPQNESPRRKLAPCQPQQHNRRHRTASRRGELHSFHISRGLQSGFRLSFSPELHRVYIITIHLSAAQSWNSAWGRSIGSAARSAAGRSATSTSAPT